MARKIVGVYYFIRFLLGLSFSFFFGTYSVFLLGAGLSLLQINLVNASFMIGCFFLEFPTGIIADAFGRKISFLLSCLTLSISFLVYYFSQSFWLFILAEVIGALGNTMYSGAFKSWMIDEVNRTGESFDLKRAYRYSMVWNGIGVMIGSFIGGYLGKIDLSYPWLASAATMAMTGIIGAMIVKENREIIHEEREGYRKFIRIAAEGYKVCVSSPVICFAAGIEFFFSFACMALNMYWQPRYQDFGLDVSDLGMLISMTKIVVIAGVLSSALVYRWLRSNQKSLCFSIGLMSLGIFFAAMSDIVWISLSMFFVHELARGMYEPLLDDYINKDIQARTRATVQSFCSMIATAGSGLGLILSGLIADNYGIKASWIFSALVIFMFFIYGALKFKK